MEAGSTPRRHALAEVAAEYGTPGAETARAKLSISLPADLLDDVRRAAAESGTSVSGVIAAVLRQSIAVADQATIDRALELDAEDGAAWARDAVELTARVWAHLEW